MEAGGEFAWRAVFPHCAGGLDAGEFYGREARALTRPTALAFCVARLFVGQCGKKRKLKHLLTLYQGERALRSKG